MGRPPRELKTFDKLFLEPGEKQRVLFLLDENDLMYFEEKSDDWTCSSGGHRIHVGGSYADIRLSAELETRGPEKAIQRRTRSDDDTESVSQEQDVALVSGDQRFL